ncbi:MAG TPA: DUF393 domain-containing protein [Candidatus Limnocylindrales bacterium]|jgi:predicted DCC family thiol-disulfide oxidoreductase YuxK
MAADDQTLTVLYDRDCGFCAWTAARIRRADRHARVRLLALQEAGDDPRIAALVADRDLHCALHAVRGDRISSGGAAALDILERLPGGPIIRAWRTLPGSRPLAEAAYAIVAGQRDRLWRLVGGDAGANSCDVRP